MGVLHQYKTLTYHPTKMFFQATLVASLAAYATAHATFQEMWVNDVDHGNYCVRLPASNSPVTSVTSDVGFTTVLHISCWLSLDSLISGPRLQRRCILVGQSLFRQPLVYFDATIQYPLLMNAPSAGDSITVEMHQQPNDRSCANQAIGGDHYGPINVSY